MSKHTRPRGIGGRLRRRGALAGALMTMGLIAFSGSASAHPGHCFAYYYQLTGANLSANVSGAWTDGMGGTANASETVTENIKKSPNVHIYAIYQRNCKPEWQLNFVDPRAHLAMSGSWSVPNGDGTTDSGTCAANLSNADLTARANSKHAQAKIGLLGDAGNNGSGPSCNGNATLGSSGLSLTDMNDRSDFERLSRVSFKFPNKPARKLSIKLHTTHTFNSPADGLTFSLTWDAHLQFKRQSHSCTYIVFDTCGLPPM